MALRSKPVNQDTFDDVIYGHQIEPKHRFAEHENGLIGIRHEHRREPVIPAPGEAVRLRVTTAGEAAFDLIRCWYRLGDRPESSVDLVATETAWDTAAWMYVRSWTGILPPVPSGERLEYRIAGLRAGTRQWQFADNQATSHQQATKFAFSMMGAAPPAWSRDAILYHVFIDRFSPGSGQPWPVDRPLNQIHGGNLRGVIERLDYIAGLGANTLWLSPVFASPTHHGYDATDLMNVEPRLGTNADLERLIDASHKRGMRIILDFVPNHWSDRHPTFRDAVAQRDSPYHDWYLWRSWPDGYEAYFDVRSMPKLNLRQGSPARNHLLDVARHWLSFGVDGYRLDHAEGPAHDFWAEFKEACLAVNPVAWLFGEIVRPPAFLKRYAGALHGCLDFALAHALRQTFALKRWSFGRFEAFLREHEAYLPPGFSSPAFLDNHDMHRFLFIAGEDRTRLKLAALMLFTLPAAPVIYYGTERGLSQDRSNAAGVGLDEARKPLDWEEDDSGGDLAAYFSRLASLRKTFLVGRSPERRLLHLDDDRGTYALLRGAGDRRFVIAFNRSDEPRTLRLEAFTAAAPEDLLSGQPVHVEEDQLVVSLAPGSGAMVASRPE